MPYRGFQVGDRVQLRMPHGLLPAGKRGVVVRRYETVVGVYDVCFDGRRTRTLIIGEYLERAPVVEAVEEHKNG